MIDRDKRVIGFTLIMLLAVSGLVWAAVPADTLRTTAAGVTTMVVDFLNATEYYMGAVNVTGYILNANPAGNGTYDNLTVTNYINLGGVDRNTWPAGGGVPYDQSLNTTDDVDFNSVNVTTWVNTSDINALDYWRNGGNYTAWIEAAIAAAPGGGGGNYSTVLVTMTPDTSGDYVCDGIADHVEIQAAIDYAETLSGARVSLGYGTYNITTGLTIQSPNIMLIGSGWGTILSTSGMTDAFITLEAANLVLRDFEINGTNQTHDVDGVENSFQGHGILIKADSGEDWENILIENIWVYDASNEGITLWSEDNQFSLFPLVYRCRIDGSSYRGVHPHNDHSLSTVNCLFSGSFGDAALRHGDVMAENRFEDINGMYIIIGSDQGAIIANNLIWGGDVHVGVAIWTTQVVGPDGSDIVANNNFHEVVTDMGPSSAVVGGGEFGVTENAIIQGNHFYNCPERNMIRLWRCTHTLITDNTFLDCCAETDNVYDIILLQDDVTDTYITNNYAFTDNANKPRFFVSETANTDYNIITDNRVTGVSTSIVNITGPNTILENLITPFVEGTEFTTTGPFGWYINDTDEYAATMGTMPDDLQQLVRIKVWAVSLNTSATGMDVNFEMYGGISNEPYTAETVQVANHGSSTTNFAANDVIYWTFLISDDVDISHMHAFDAWCAKVTYNVAYGDDIKTDAVFYCIELEYV